MTNILEDQQKIKFHEALQQTYAGCLFDIDGTLTMRGDEFIPDFLKNYLAEKSLSVPMGVCTARKFDHALAKISQVFESAKNPLECQKNWVLICENGCLGYSHNPQTNKYEEFYRVPFPYDAAHFQNLFAHLKKVLEGKLQMCFTCEVTMIFRPVRVDDNDREALSQRSRELAQIIEQELPKFDPKGLLKIGNSGIGVTIFPANGNKEQGTLHFAQFLRERKNAKIGDEAREIVVVGDQPIPPGNDTVFLNGQYGTPFTVGETHPENLLPLPVFNASGEIMKGPEGTLTLLQQLQL